MPNAFRDWVKWVNEPNYRTADINTQTQAHAQNKIAILLAKFQNVLILRRFMVNVIKFYCRRTSKLLIELNKTIDGIYLSWRLTSQTDHASPIARIGERCHLSSAAETN